MRAPNTPHRTGLVERLQSLLSAQGNRLSPTQRCTLFEAIGELSSPALVSIEADTRAAAST